MTTTIQVFYKPDQDGNQETELISFASDKSASAFLESIRKNPDVISAKKT